MSKLFSKLFTWFIILIIVVSVISSFRTGVMTGGEEYDMFVAVFSDFPFAEQMAEIVSNICQYRLTLQGLTSGNIITDLAKLFGMTLVCPLVMGFATMLLLPVPNYSDWYAREQYMSRPSYRIKEALVHMVAMPFCAWATAKLVEFVHNWLAARLPFLNPTVIGLAMLVLMIAAATVNLWLRSGFSFGSIFRHRLLDDLLGNLLKILGLNLFCFAIALGILNDQGGVALSMVVLLFIYLAGISLMLDGIRGLFS